jgi:hypothetical protein
METVIVNEVLVNEALLAATSNSIPDAAVRYTCTSALVLPKFAPVIVRVVVVEANFGTVSVTRGSLMMGRSTPATMFPTLTAVPLFPYACRDIVAVKSPVGMRFVSLMSTVITVSVHDITVESMGVNALIKGEKETASDGGQASATGGGVQF